MSLTERLNPERCICGHDLTSHLDMRRPSACLAGCRAAECRKATEPRKPRWLANPERFGKVLA